MSENDSTTVDDNRAMIRTAFEAVSRGDFERLRPLLAEDFVEHSPGVPSGRDAWLEAARNGRVATASFELRRMVADDDHVVIHYRMRTPGDPGDFAVMAIFRIVDGIVTEHWDAVQPVGPDGSDDMF